MKAALYRLKSLEPYLPPKHPSTFEETLNQSHLYIISKSRTVTIASDHFQKLPLFASSQTDGLKTRNTNHLVDCIEISSPGFNTPETDEEYITYNPKDNEFFPVGDTFKNIQIHKYGLTYQLSHGENQPEIPAYFLAASLNKAGQQKVLYVGKSYGKNGENNSGTRISGGHKKLNQILADHQRTPSGMVGWDIFVTPLILDQSSSKFISCTQKPSYSSSRLDTTVEATSEANSISIAEHMLVTYFQPEYNDQLKSWSRTEPLKTLSNAGIDTLLLELHLHDNHPPVGFFSKNRPSRQTCHYIAANTPGTPGARKLDGWHEFIENISDKITRRRLLQIRDFLCEFESTPPYKLNFHGNDMDDWDDLMEQITNPQKSLR